MMGTTQTRWIRSASGRDVAPRVGDRRRRPRGEREPSRRGDGHLPFVPNALRAATFACAAVSWACVGKVAQEGSLDASATRPSDGASLATRDDATADSSTPSSPSLATDGYAQPPESDSGTGPAAAPPDGRCGLTPRMLVPASSIPVPTDAGPVTVGVGTIAVSPSALYYTTYVVQNFGGNLANLFLAGSLMSIPLGGGEPMEVASSGLYGRPLMTATGAIVGVRGGIASNPGGDSIIFVPFSGGPPVVLVALANGFTLGNGIATDGTFVYYSGQDIEGNAGGVEATPLDAADAGQLTVVAAGPYPYVFPDVIGAFGQRLMFIFPQGEIQSVALPPQANSPVSMLGMTTPGPGDLVPCGTDACWLGMGIDEIDPIDGGPIKVHSLIGPVATAWDYAFDGTSFYVMGSSGGVALPAVQSLARIPFGGGGPVVVVNMPYHDDGAVTVDDECVYWSNSEGIFNLSKTAQGPFDQ
jgi:hypothetical protein